MAVRLRFERGSGLAYPPSIAEIARHFALDEKLIPRILHFTWKTESLPGVMGRYFEKWRALHPDWDIRLWTDVSMRAFVAEAYPELLATYDGYERPIQRADTFRYMVLDRLGGVYSDLDVEPLRRIDALISPLKGFLGVEPGEHAGGDRVHSGVPFLLSNAFMGSEPGHPLWREVLGLLPALRDQHVFFSTGPSMLTGATLRLQPADRPSLLLPLVWSPLQDGGFRTRGDAILAERLRDVAPIIQSDGRPFVSHKWLTTWVKWHQRHSALKGVYRFPNHLKWWLRQRQHSALAKTRISDPLSPYTGPMTGVASPGPSIFVGVRLDGSAPLDQQLAAALLALKYPSGLMQFGFFSQAKSEAEVEAVRASVAGTFSGQPYRIDFETPSEAASTQARARANDHLVQWGASAADKVLLVSGTIRDIPADAVLLALCADRPVVAASVLDAEGKPDLSVFRYYEADFRTLYKAGGEFGEADPRRGYRSSLNEQRAFSLVPLDGVGDSFVLIDSAVIRAGGRFPGELYKLHRNGEAFGIMARDLGFEVAGLTGLVVRTGDRTD